MGSFQFKTTIAGLLALASATTAQAADLLPPPPMPAPVEVGGGWYLRGDVGVGSLDFKGSAAYDRSTPAQPYSYKTSQDTIGDQVFVGAGIGYQLNPWLRFDVTGEYRTAADWRFIAEDKSAGTIPDGYDLLTGKFSTVVGLANAYIDLGNWYGVTPFVGAGVGFAHHMFDSVTDQGLLAYNGGYGYGAPKDKTNFAWALHAGLGYDVTPNLKLELAYRYLNMGDAETGTVACLPTCAIKTSYKVKEIDSQDIKIGMRWMFGGPVAPMPASYGAPIIRKY
jgi:opacity protein-like surface antigen